MSKNEILAKIREAGVESFDAIMCNDNLKSFVVGLNVVGVRVVIATTDHRSHLVLQQADTRWIIDGDHGAMKRKVVVLGDGTTLKTMVALAQRAGASVAFAGDA